MYRFTGQRSIICDRCGAIFDDRPRNLQKDVIAEAKRAGWLIESTYQHKGTSPDLCPACAKTKGYNHD